MPRCRLSKRRFARTIPRSAEHGLRLRGPLQAYSVRERSAESHVGYSSADPTGSGKGVPICGKDFKTGQTLMKTIIAPD